MLDMARQYKSMQTQMEMRIQFLEEEVKRLTAQLSEPWGEWRERGGSGEKEEGVGRGRREWGERGGSGEREEGVGREGRKWGERGGSGEREEGVGEIGGSEERRRSGERERKE